MNETLVEPKTAPAAPVAVEPTAEAAAAAPPPPEEAQAGLPEELLKIPAMQGLFAGQPPALSADMKAFANRPEAQLIGQSQQQLLAAGIGAYRSLSGDVAVLFNRFYIAPEEIQAADKEQKLLEVAPPFDAVNAQIAGSGEKNPVLAKRESPQGFKTAPAPQPPQSGSVIKAPTPSSEAETVRQTARTKAMTAQGPTSGPKPAAGRLLNNILRPVI
jgi:hypothetical protein